MPYMQTQTLNPVEPMKKAGPAKKTERAVFFDIDGTLINIMNGQTRLTKRTRQAIGALRKAGDKTFIASGRPTGYLDPELLDVELFDGYVLMNGAHVVYDGQTIYEQPLPKATVAAIVALCEENGIEYILEAPDGIYLRPEFQNFRMFYDSIDIDTRTFHYAFALENVATCKMEFYSDTPNGGGLFQRFLAWDGLTGLMDPFHKKNLELYSAQETKGSGILHALHALHLPVTRSFAFGDGLNDIEMMQIVGTAIAMGNAQPPVKAVADHIVPSVDEEGVAWGIEHLLLKA